ncbi:MAG: hypothetical protein IPH07_27510 [Deltaproteobacteria bacterium]|nr:hypothetical protein [Deltaproteobacteria bacterium]MBK8714641.1 hypothetical protein [Deltaproteobacteria bacterium]MBP7291833.1 hypothetical protein [Nannocystaceae bacterium]
MTAPISLRDVNFGKDTAEFDRDLARYFLATETYNRILAGKKSIIAGRKGSGKTALMNFFVADATPTQAVITLEASQATLLKIKQSIDRLGQDLADLDASFKHAWLFSAMLALAERVIARKFALTEDAQLVHKFAKEHLSYRNGDAISTVANYVISWFVHAKSISVGDIAVEREVPAIAAHALVFDERTLLRLITSSARELNRRGETVYLFFDKLDERWEASRGNVALVQGLLLASRDLRALNLDLNPVVLIRDDILRVATEGFQHSDHFRMETEWIQWNEDSLLSLLAKRIAHSLRAANYAGFDALPPKDLWELVFEPSIPFKRVKIPMAAWLIERTLARPRDLVLFANLAIEQALSSGDTHAPIAKERVRAVERRFSEQKLDDLVAELSVEFPDAKIIFERFRLRPHTFATEELDVFLEDLVTDATLGLNWLPVDVADVKRWLYQIGFMCFSKIGGSLRGTRVIHSGIERQPGEFMIARKISVSPIFRSALQMRDRKHRDAKADVDDDDDDDDD